MALDTGNAKDKLFGNLKKEKIEPKEELPEKEEQIPKWQSFDKVTTLLTPEQKAGLDAVARSLMKYRSSRTKGKDKERITSNTLIRALIDAFLEKKDSYQLEVLITEEEVKKWIKSN
jgi:hypothetical protein